MKRMNLIGLALLAMFALSGLAAGTASAEHCTRVAVAGTGSYGRINPAVSNACEGKGEAPLNYVKIDPPQQPTSEASVACAKVEPGEPSTFEDPACTKAKSGTGEYTKVIYEPEIGECVKMTGGKYSDSGCTKLVATKGKFEWSPGAKAGEKKFRSAGTKAALVIVGGDRIACEGVINTGEYLNAFEGETTVAFTGCKIPGLDAVCENTGSKGEIVTNRLNSVLGIIKEEALGKSSIGVSLTAVPPSTTLATFECAGVEMKATGSVITPQTVANKMETRFTQTYKQNGGIQEPTKFENEPEDVLILEIPVLRAKEQSGQEVKVTVTNQSKVEAREF